MHLDIVEIEGEGGETLFIRDCRPDAGTFSPVLVWIHGLGEHGGRYLHVAETLAEHGWRFITGDLRGHGRSSGSRTHVLSFDEYSKDVARIWKQLKLGSGRAALCGHSMGGLVAVRAVQMGLVEPSALVLSSPLLRLKSPINPIKLLLGRLLVGFFPEARFRNGLDANNMTRDSEFTRLRREDPLINRTVTASWFFAMQAALVQAHRDASKITIPILAMTGLADETIDGDAVAAWLAMTSSSMKELVTLPGHVHELLHEPDWRETLNRLADWLERSGAARV